MKHLAWGTAVSVCLTTGAAASASTRDADAEERNAHCLREFDATQRADMESFRDFDAATFRRVHADDAVSIYPTGERFTGIDAIMAAAANHFTRKYAVWSWTELNRRVDGCRSAVITYDATYDIPKYEYHQRALTVVTYVYERGRWQAVMDQGTLLEISS
ncbi:nuclear transport factor 2 family protein [Kribbella sindirgiensis]|nr:nuclear transport factor 2 family protein [Kribbella sindirgiensis]